MFIIGRGFCLSQLKLKLEERRFISTYLPIFFGLVTENMNLFLGMVENACHSKVVLHYLKQFISLDRGEERFKGKYTEGQKKREWCVGVTFM